MAKTTTAPKTHTVHVAEKPAKAEAKPEPTEAQQLRDLLLSGDTETVRNGLVKRFGIGFNVDTTNALIDLVKEQSEG